MASGMNLPTSSLRSHADASRVMISTIFLRICLIWLVCAYAVFFTCAHPPGTGVLSASRSLKHTHRASVALHPPFAIATHRRGSPSYRIDQAPQLLHVQPETALPGQEAADPDCTSLHIPGHCLLVR